MTENTQNGQPLNMAAERPHTCVSEEGGQPAAHDPRSDAGESIVVADSPATEKTGRERQIEALSLHGKSTQFGGARGNPINFEGAAKTWSMRHQVRYLGARGKLNKLKSGEWEMELPDDCSPIQRLAAQAIIDGLNAKSAHSRIRAIQYITEQVDGKLVQPNLNADLAALQSMSEDEIDAYIAELQRLADQASNSDGYTGEATQA